MTAKLLIATSMVVTGLRVLWAIPNRSPVRRRERLKTLVSLVLVLAIVLTATLGYLELVATLLEFSSEDSALR